MKKHNLKRFSLKVLIRLWFRRLWQKYDSGGHSGGRSLRCHMLDCFLDFTSFPKLTYPLDEYSEGLEIEILSRPICLTRRMFLKIEDIEHCTKQGFALLGLGTLLALEYSVHKDTAWKEGYELERKKIRDILRRFPVIFPHRSCDIQEFCWALIKRRGDLEYLKNKHRIT